MALQFTFQAFKMKFPSRNVNAVVGFSSLIQGNKAELQKGH